MSKIRIKNLQTAQGMVEFALVLPILLLVILGVFAFGHMFFVYSSVVSASREAARWGAAVGTAGGAAALPRYQDCGAIIASAVRIGAFAGVGPSSVAIDYDSGPGTTVNPNGNCPAGGTGPEVSLGDRIKVTVTVMYKPIVPFINLPTFPLTATSARTIIKSLPVGEAPTAKPLWPQATVVITPAPDLTTPKVVVVGEPATFKVSVMDNTTPITVGTVTVNDDDGNVCLPGSFIPTASGVNCTITFPHANLTAGDLQKITARYDPGTAHYFGDAKDVYVKVNPAGTTVHVASPSLTTSGGGLPWANPIVLDANHKANLSIQAYITVNAPGALVVPDPANPPHGSVHIDVDTAHGLTSICTYDYVLNTSNTLTPICTHSLTNSDLGLKTYTVTFDGTADYQPSSYSFTVEVRDAPATPVTPPSATTVAPATSEPGTTPTPPPTATDVPSGSGCPFANVPRDIFSQYPSSLYFEIYNPSSNKSGLVSLIDRIEVTWPTEFNAKLSEVLFGASVGTSDPNTNRLIYFDPATGTVPAPPSAVLPPTGYTFNSLATTLPVDNNQSTLRYLRLTFNGTLPSGNYTIKVHFTDAGNRNCQLQINATR